MTDDVLPVTAASMHARRRPWAIVVMWAWQAALALTASGPAASLVRTAYGTDPLGDTPLWSPGAHALLDFLAHSRPCLGALKAAAFIALTTGLVAGLVPMAALMIAIAYATRERRAVGLSLAIREALRAFPALALLLLLAGSASVVTIGAGVGCANVVGAWAHDALGEARAAQMGVAIGLLFLLPVSAFGVLHDLSRAAVVRFKLSGLRALGLGTRAFEHAPRTLWWSWAWRTLASLAPPIVAAVAADRLGGRRGVALVLLALLHQAAIFARIAFRASWLAKALRTVDGEC